MESSNKELVNKKRWKFLFVSLSDYNILKGSDIDLMKVWLKMLSD